MSMDASSAISALQETRAHASSVHEKVTDFQTKFQQLEQTAEQKFTEIQHMQEALLQHIAQERDRARQENEQIIALFHDTTEWIHQSGTTLANDTKSLSDDLDAAEHGSEAGATALQQATEHLQQLADKAKQDFAGNGQQLQEHVDKAHTDAHTQFTQGLTQMEQTVSSTSDQHEQEIDHAYSNDFHTQQQQAHQQIEQTGTQASQQLHQRGDKLHGDVSHEVDTLTQHQDQHHQDLSHTLDQVKSELTTLGHTVTETAHGMADGVDGASLLAQQTNLGVQEIMKIIQNIESIFQDLINQFHG